MRLPKGWWMGPTSVLLAPLSVTLCVLYIQVHKPRYRWGGSTELCRALHLAAVLVALFGVALSHVIAATQPGGRQCLGLVALVLNGLAGALAAFLWT